MRTPDFSYLEVLSFDHASEYAIVCSMSQTHLVPWQRPFWSAPQRLRIVLYS